MPEIIDIDAMIAAKSANTTETKQPEEVISQTPETPAAVTPPAETPAATQTPTSPIKKFDEQEQPAATTTDASTSEPAVASSIPDEDEEFDLREVYVDVDGTERSASDLITERNEYAARLATIEKDEFLKGFIEHYLATGNADAYLDAKAVNWDKKDDVETLRHKFEAANRDLDPKIVEKLWKRELADKYKVKPDLSQEEIDSEDYEIAQGLLKRDANNARNEFKTTQSQFKLPEAKATPAQQPQQFDAQAYKRQLLADKEVDAFAKRKLLKLDVSDESGASFGFEVDDSDTVIEMMADDRKFWSTLMKDNKVDRTKQAKLYAYAKDPKKFEQGLVDFGKTLAIEARLKEVKNTDGQLNKQTVAAANQGDYKTRFLKEALRQKQLRPPEQ
jgi:hypothetical protein